MKTLACDTRGNMTFTDMSDGLSVCPEMQNVYINRVLEKLREGYTHWSIQTGNFLVIGLAHDSQYQIFITEAYKDTAIYKRDGNPALHHAVAY